MRWARRSRRVRASSASSPLTGTPAIRAPAGSLAVEPAKAKPRSAPRPTKSVARSSDHCQTRRLRGRRLLEVAEREACRMLTWRTVPGVSACQGARFVTRFRIDNGRRRALAGFGAFGLYWGTWGALLPALQRDTVASDGELGAALLLVGVGALISMRTTGWLFDRFGAAVTPSSVALLTVAGVLPGLASSPLGLYASSLALGAASGAMDVAVNADAVREEVATGRPLLNLAHAAFSAAVVAASLLTGGLRSADASADVVLLAVAATIALVGFALRAAPSRPVARSTPGLSSLRKVPGGLLIVGGLVALAYWVEGAWQSWSAVHLERTLDAAAAASALGPAAFAAAATAG